MRGLPAIVLLFGMLGCGGADDGDGDDVDAASALDEQRASVRRLTAHLAPALAAGLGGGRVETHGAWRGCVTAEVDGAYGSYHYAVQARLAVPAGRSRPYLDSLVPILRTDGFEVTVTHDREVRDLTAERDGQTVTAREYVDHDEFVVWGVSGACVDVPEDERDVWMNRQEPSPDVLADPDVA